MNELVGRKFKIVFDDDGTQIRTAIITSVSEYFICFLNTRTDLEECVNQNKITRMEETK